MINVLIFNEFSHEKRCASLIRSIFTARSRLL